MQWWFRARFPASRFPTARPDPASTAPSSSSGWTRRPAPRPESTSCFGTRSEEHTSELQSLMRISYAVFCLKKNKQTYLLYKIFERPHKKTTAHKQYNITHITGT